MATIDIGLIQNKYTDFIVYDETDRTIIDDQIDLADILGVTIIFQSPVLEHNKIYKFDYTKLAYVIGYDTFSNYDFSQYNQNKTMQLLINGIDSITFDIYINCIDADDLVDELNTQASALDILFVNNGGTIELQTTTSGSDKSIQVISGDLLDIIKWNIGIYRGNDIKWSTDILQKDFNFLISVEDFGYTTEIPETYWDIQYNVVYTTDEFIYTDTFTEFTYKQTEIYYAKLLEYISRNFSEIATIEQRLQTDMELFMQRSVYFSSVYKAFLASIEINDVDKAEELLDYIIKFKTLNPIL